MQCERIVNVPEGEVWSCSGLACMEGEKPNKLSREGPINHFTRFKTRLSRMKTRDPCHWRKVIFPCATACTGVRGYRGTSPAAPHSDLSLVFLGIELLFGFSCSSGWETIPSSSRASTTPGPRRECATAPLSPALLSCASFPSYIGQPQSASESKVHNSHVQRTRPSDDSSVAAPLSIH